MAFSRFGRCCGLPASGPRFNYRGSPPQAGAGVGGVGFFDMFGRFGVIHEAGAALLVRVRVAYW